MNPRNYWKLREALGALLAIAIVLAFVVQLIKALFK